MLESSLLHSKSFARAKENAVKVGVEKGLTLDTQRKVLLKMGHQRATVEKVVSYMNKRFELLSSNDGTNNNSSDTEGEKKNINGGRATVGGDNGDGVHFSVGTLLRLVDFKEFVVSVALAFYLDEEENEKYTRYGSNYVICVQSMR